MQWGHFFVRLFRDLQFYLMFQAQLSQFPCFTLMGLPLKSISVACEWNICLPVLRAKRSDLILQQKSLLLAPSTWTSFTHFDLIKVAVISTALLSSLGLSSPERTPEKSVSMLFIVHGGLQKNTRMFLVLHFTWALSWLPGFLCQGALWLQTVSPFPRPRGTRQQTVAIPSITIVQHVHTLAEC